MFPEEHFASSTRTPVRVDNLWGHQWRLFSVILVALNLLESTLE